MEIQIIFKTMKTRVPLILLFIFLFGYSAIHAQNKYEREYRIKKSEFPSNALDLISNKIEDAKRVKFYKEMDSTKISYEAKLKKDKLWYSIEFSEKGILEDIEILIDPVDVPNDAFQNIENYLKANYSKYKIKRLQQQYPTTTDEDVETTLKIAFQNLLLPTTNYELVIGGQKDRTYLDYEILFDSEGNFKKSRTSLPLNYDHVLY